MTELRFHLLDLSLERYTESVNAAHEAGITVGIEYQLSRKEEKLMKLLSELDSSVVSPKFKREMEITIGNQENMDVRGFNLAGGITAAAEALQS